VDDAAQFSEINRVSLLGAAVKGCVPTVQIRFGVDLHEVHIHATEVGWCAAFGHAGNPPLANMETAVAAVASEGGRDVRGNFLRDRSFLRELPLLIPCGVPLDQARIDYGAPWAAAIETQIETCAVFVPVMSDHARRAPWVTREVDLAQELDKPIMPLLLAGRRFLRLRDLQDEDVTDGQLPGDGFVVSLRRHTAAAESPALMETSYGRRPSLAGWVTAWGSNSFGQSA